MSAVATALAGASLLLALLSALACYLGTAHQHLWPALVRHRPAARATACVLALLALGTGCAARGLWAGVFLALTAFMLGAVAWPYLDAWRRLRRERAHVG